MDIEKRLVVAIHASIRHGCPRDEHVLSVVRELCVPLASRGLREKVEAAGIEDGAVASHARRLDRVIRPVGRLFSGRPDDEELIAGPYDIRSSRVGKHRVVADHLRRSIEDAPVLSHASCEHATAPVGALLLPDGEKDAAARCYRDSVLPRIIRREPDAGAVERHSRRAQARCVNDSGGAVGLIRQPRVEPSSLMICPNTSPRAM